MAAQSYPIAVMTTSEVLLSTTYFGPVQWYQKLFRYQHVSIEMCESFQKQTYRNRCLIAAANGVQALTVPVEKAEKAAGKGEETEGSHLDIRSVRISDHGNWRHQHWQAICSAYGDSPFFEFYEDDLRPFFFEEKWELLVDFNEAIRRTVCQLLDINPTVTPTTEYHADSTADDFRYAISPKKPLADDDFTPRPYYQVFAQRHGFLPNLSILDLLCNMGPESIFYL